MIGPQVISKGTMDSLEEASAYFKQVLQEHLDNKRYHIVCDYRCWRSP